MPPMVIRFIYLGKRLTRVNRAIAALGVFLVCPDDLRTQKTAHPLAHGLVLAVISVYPCDKPAADKRDKPADKDG